MVLFRINLTKNLNLSLILPDLFETANEIMCEFYHSKNTSFTFRTVFCSFRGFFNHLTTFIFVRWNLKGPWISKKLKRDCKDDFLIILCFRFNTEDVGGFIFADQLLQVSARLPSHTLYGLGYQRNDLQLDMNWRLITLFNRDQEPSDKVCLFYIIISLVYLRSYWDN